MAAWTLRPNATVSTVSVNNVSGATHHNSISDNNDGTYITPPNNTDGTAVFRLEDVPSDFASMTSIGLDVRVRGSGIRIDDNYVIFMQLFADDALTIPLTNEVQVAAWGQANLTTFTTLANAAVIQGTPTQAQWNSAVLRIRFDHQPAMSSDGITMQVAEAYINIVYTPVTLTAPVLTVDSVTTREVNLTASAVTGATNYEFQRDSVTQQISASRTFGDINRTQGATYAYRVRATNANGAGPWSNVQNVTMLPEPPTNLVATVISSSQIDLSWTAAVGATGYDVYLVQLPQPLSSNQAGTTYSVNNLQGGTQYEFEVYARSAGGQNPTPATATATTPQEPPTQKPSLQAQNITQSSVDIHATGYIADNSWDTFEFQRDAVTVQNTALSTFLDTGLTAETTYTYRVRMVNSVGEGPWSDNLQITTLAEVLNVPFSLWNGTEWVQVTPSVKT